MTKATTISAGALAVAMLGMATFPLANAAPITDELEISNYESVSAQLSASGELQSAIIVDQLTIFGNGETVVTNPVTGGSQRNLSGFEQYAVTNGAVETTVSANGTTELRSLADYEGELPVSLTAKYFLDGAEVTPEEVAGATGKLRVEYTVANETGQLETITFTDAAGETVTKEVMVYTPIAGSFSTVLPSSFSNVASPEAAVAADGRGATKVQWSLTLLPPLSSPTATFGYTADIANGQLPEANLSVIPVQPNDNPTASSAVASYESGAASGAELYAGGVALDDGLTQLADGAGQLLAGLAKLADGAGRLSDGAAAANDGAQALSAGAAKLDAGAAQLADGSGQLAGGLAQLAGGFDTLEEQQAFQQIVAGLSAISAGVGDPDSWAVDGNGVPADLNSALNHLRAGLDQELIPGLQLLHGGAQQSKQDLAPLVAVTPTAVAGAQQLLDLINQGATVTLNTPQGPMDITEHAGKALTYTVTAGGAIEQVDSGLDASIAGTGRLIGGAQQLSGGLAAVQPKVNEIGAGADALKAGVEQIYAVIATDMANGVRDLSAGADRLDAGMTDLSAGTGQLSAGSAELAAGTGQLAGGAGELAAGMTQANEAGPALTDGIGRLSSEGAQGIMAAGMGTQLQYGEMVAQVAKAAERTEDGALPAGAPEDARVATAAYSFDVAGTDAAGVSPTTLALIAAGLFGAAGIGMAYRSRRSA